MTELIPWLTSLFVLGVGGTLVFFIIGVIDDEKFMLMCSAVLCLCSFIICSMLWYSIGVMNATPKPTCPACSIEIIEEYNYCPTCGFDLEG